MKEIIDDPDGHGDETWYSWAFAIGSAIERASRTGRRHQVRRNPLGGRQWLVQEIR